jgi:hypothetical protein
MTAFRTELDDVEAEAARRLAGVKDRIYVTTRIHFGWLDRLRVLLGAQVIVRSCTETENVAGWTHTPASAVELEPLWHRPGGPMQVVLEARCEKRRLGLSRSDYLVERK